MPKVLTQAQIDTFQRDGCLSPVRAMSAERARHYRDRFEALEARVPDIKKMKTKSHLLWKKTKGLPYIASALVYRGQYVMVRDGGLVTAYDAKTGKEVYVQERAAAAGPYYASPVAANGHIYLTALDDGTVTVLKAGATDRVVEVARSNFAGA